MFFRAVRLSPCLLTLPAGAQPSVQASGTAERVPRTRSAPADPASAASRRPQPAGCGGRYLKLPKGAQEAGGHGTVCAPRASSSLLQGYLDLFISIYANI